jgi:hypothetical protein
VLELKAHRDKIGQTDCESGRGQWLTSGLICGVAVNFTEYDSLPSGQVSLINRVKYVGLSSDLHPSGGWMSESG